MVQSLCWIDKNELAGQLERLGVEIGAEADIAEPAPDDRADADAPQDRTISTQRYVRQLAVRERSAVRIPPPEPFEPPPTPTDIEGAVDEPTGPLPVPFDEPDETSTQPQDRESTAAEDEKRDEPANEVADDEFPPPIDVADEGDDGMEAPSEPEAQLPAEHRADDEAAQAEDDEALDRLDETALPQPPWSLQSLEQSLTALAEALVEKTEGRACFVTDDEGLPLALYGAGEAEAAAATALRSALSPIREIFDDAIEQSLTLEYREGATLHLSWLDTPTGTYTIGLFSPQRFRANLGQAMRTALGHVMDVMYG